MSKSTQTPWDAAQTIRPRARDRLLTIDELESAAIDLEAKRWEAVEWARERGVRLLKDEYDGQG